MSNAADQKKPIPRGFLKKRLEEKQNKEKSLESHESELEIQKISTEESCIERQIDFHELVKDLMFNKYFYISENEAKPIASKMISEGSQYLHEVRWFLTPLERVNLAKFLSQKHSLD